MALASGHCPLLSTGQLSAVLSGASKVGRQYRVGLQNRLIWDTDRPITWRFESVLRHSFSKMSEVSKKKYRLYRFVLKKASYYGGDAVGGGLCWSWKTALRKGKNSIVVPHCWEYLSITIILKYSNTHEKPHCRRGGTIVVPHCWEYLRIWVLLLLAL